MQFIEMSTALKDTFTVISSALQDGYSVQVGDITTELPGMSLDTARKCLFAYAKKHSRDVEVSRSGSIPGAGIFPHRRWTFVFWAPSGWVTLTWSS